jgi:hypothetical protein
MNSKFSTLFFFLFFATFSFGQKYKWPDYVVTEIPDSLKNEKAIFLTNVETYDFLDTYESVLTYFKRIYIQNKLGAESFSTFELPIFSYGNVEKMFSRIIKPSGEIVLINDENIKITRLTGKSDYTQKSLKRVQVIYPDLQPGDVIDISYTVKFPRYLYSQLLTLESFLPSLYSRITLRNMSKLDIDVFPMNNVGKNGWSTQGGIPTFDWEKNGVSVYYSDGFNSLNPNAPRIYYNMVPVNRNVDYGFFYSLDCDNFPVIKSFDTKLINRLLTEGVFTKEDDYFSRLLKLMKHIKGFKWIPDSEVKTSDKAIVYYDAQRVNYELYFKYIQQFLDESKVEYERCFTKSLINGPFEKGLAIFDQLEDRFLTVKDTKGAFHYIFPPSEKDHFYHIDEIPFYNEGNNSIAMSGDDINVKNIVDMKLPESTMLENKHSTQVKLNIEKNDSIYMSYSRKDIITGHCSNLLRGNDTLFWLSSFGISDKLIEPTKIGAFFPYELEYSQDSLTSKGIQSIEDSLYWLNFEAITIPYLYDEDELIFELGDYIVLPFKKMNIYSIYISAPNNITCQEQEAFLKFENSIGEISAKMISVSPTMLKVEFVAKVKTRVVEGEESVEEYKMFLTKWNEIQHKKWIVSM